MMREILFRGKFGNEWKYGFLSIEPKGLVIKEPYKNESSNVWHIDADTVGQYTDLTDKNGTKIFELPLLNENYICKLYDINDAQRDKITFIIAKGKPEIDFFHFLLIALCLL